MSPHHVSPQIKQESKTVFQQGSTFVSDPEFTKSSLSTEHFESAPPSRVQANHHLSLQFLFSPVHLKDSSIILSQPLRLTDRAAGNYEHQEKRNIPHPYP